MATGSRNEKGEATDFVVHYIKTNSSDVLCGKKKVGCAHTDKTQVTCLNCLKKLS